MDINLRVCRRRRGGNFDATRCDWQLLSRKIDTCGDTTLHGWRNRGDSLLRMGVGILVVFGSFGAYWVLQFLYFNDHYGLN